MLSVSAILTLIYLPTSEPLNMLPVWLPDAADMTLTLDAEGGPLALFWITCLPIENRLIRCDGGISFRYLLAWIKMVRIGDEKTKFALLSRKGDLVIWVYHVPISQNVYLFLSSRHDCWHYIK